MIIGERMSEVTDLSAVVFRGNDFYASDIDALIERPLDAARLIYYLLQQDLPEVEVVWNHFDDIITILVQGHEIMYVDRRMARTDKVEGIRQFVQSIKESLCQG